MDRYVPSRRLENPPVYHFGGYHSVRPPSPPGRDVYDSYRPPPPLPPPGDFSFRYQSDRPAPHFPSEPSYNQNNQGGRRGRSRPDVGRRFADRQSQRPTQRPRRGGSRKRYPPVSDRPLLSGQRQTTPEQLEGMGDGEARFTAWDDLSDSQEEEMDLESRASRQASDIDSIVFSLTFPSSDQERLPKKARIITDETTDGIQSAKWSNPDPYSALPPPDVTHGKRKDVVRVIRKAKIAAAKGLDTMAENTDFVSFDFDVNESTSEDSSVVVDADDGVVNNSFTNNSLAGNGVSDYQSIIDLTGPDSPPPLPSDVKEALEVDVWPPAPPPLPQHEPAISHQLAGSRDIASQQLGRKRKRDDYEVIGPNCAILMPEWRPKSSKNATPWFDGKIASEVAASENIGTRLHKEIWHFYEYVRPLPHEDRIRDELVNRVQNFLDKRYSIFKPVVLCFGSFAAGVYLPNADMDLVVHSGDYRTGGYPSMGQSGNTLRKFGASLEASRLAAYESLIVIPKARVPLVKYVDQMTSLRVDISFENDSGVIANHTFNNWKAEHPAMIVLATLVKQFLLMRGLNDVAQGGLGGFSVTCLIVSLMQHLPQLQSKAMDPMQHLGEMLLEFFDFYGNRFNTSTTGISFNPPSHFQKHLNLNLRYNKSRPWGLCIEDPNRPENDVSGGSGNIRTITKCFSEAASILQKRMNDVQRGDLPPGDNGSILGVIFGGDYTVFESQREILRNLSSKRY